MKICIVSGGAYSLFNPSVKFHTGGAEKQLYYIGKELAKSEGVEVSFLVADYGQDDVEEYDGIKVYKLTSSKPPYGSGNKIYKICSKIISKAKNFVLWCIVSNIFSILGKKNIFDSFCCGSKLYKHLKRIKADVYISKTVNVSHLFNILHCRIHKKKFIYMVAHDREVSYKSIRKLSDMFTSLCMEFTYKFADFITFQSEDQRALFQMNRKVKNHDIIKNIFIFKNDDNTVKDYKGGFLWVGRCERWKRPELYLDLAERFPDETFTMICPKTDWKYEFWEEIKARALRISNVKFYDFVNNHEIHKFYREAKLYIITSDMEGFSNTMMEAMSERCPVLSLNVNPDNIIGRYNLGICAGGDYERYAAEIDILRKDAAKCREYGNNGYEYLKSEHEAVSITAKLFEIVKGVHERPYVKNK